MQFPVLPIGFAAAGLSSASVLTLIPEMPVTEQDQNRSGPDRQRGVTAGTVLIPGMDTQVPQGLRQGRVDFAQLPRSGRGNRGRKTGHTQLTVLRVNEGEPGAAEGGGR